MLRNRYKCTFCIRHHNERNHGEGPYSWLKAATTAFTFKTLLKHYQGRYNGRILGKKSEIRPNALFWSEFGGILRSLEKFGGI